MQDIAEHLHGTTKSMKVLELPGLGERTDKHGKDFSDWADIDGNDQKKLNELISDASEWSPLEVFDENLAVVEELNLKHFVTMIGGKTTVVNEVHDPAMERNILTYSTPTDFKNYYSNRFITIDDRPVPIGHHWFKHPLRRQFPGILSCLEKLLLTWGIIIYGKDLTSPRKPSIQLSRITSRGFQFFGII